MQSFWHGMSYHAYFFKSVASYVQFDSDEMFAYVFPHFVFREHFGHKHPKYSDTLLDYGFYLLNVDNICQSVVIYQVSYCKNYLIWVLCTFK